MISRILIPTDVKPVSTDGESARPRRASTFLDDRQIIPNELPIVVLDTRSNIPAHVPLDVLGERYLVPRDVPMTPLERPTGAAQEPSPTRLDLRMVVPKSARSGQLDIRKPAVTGGLYDLVDSDVLTTGVVNLLAKPVEEENTGWHLQGNWQARASSILFHALLFVLILLQPKLFPYRPPSPEEIEVARRSLGLIYLPQAPPTPYVPPQQISPQVRIHPDVLRQVVPAEQPSSGSPEPPRTPAKELPSAPEPRGQGSAAGFSAPPPIQRQPETPSTTPRFETPKNPEPGGSTLGLKGVSPGRALDDSLKGASRSGGSINTGPPGGGQGGGGGPASFGPVELLTPTEGVDFTSYLNRVLARVRFNWYAVIPESARMGEKGKVVLEFRIMKNGSVPNGEPILVRGSGRDPLDFAAASSIKTSNPFEPLPSAFSGPFIALRFTYLYNLPIDYQ